MGGIIFGVTVVVKLFQCRKVDRDSEQLSWNAGTNFNPILKHPMKTLKFYRSFITFRIDQEETEGAVLQTPKSIVEAVLANRVLNGRIRIESDGYIAILDYPIKTMNANERDNIYQPDTGPVLFPDLSREPDDLIGGMNLAFVAFNTADWIELLVRVPTFVTEDVSVYHYSHVERLDSQNQIIALG